MADEPACEYKFPVWGTQGGGLVKETSPGVYTFVEAPADCPSLNVGDTMPEEWGIVPANSAARHQRDDDQMEWDMGVSTLFDAAFERLGDGSMSIEDVGRLFPKGTAERIATAKP